MARGLEHPFRVGAVVRAVALFPRGDLCAQVGCGLGGDGGDFAVAAVVRAMAFGAGFDLFAGVALFCQLFAAFQLRSFRRCGVFYRRRRQRGVVGGDVGGFGVI